MIYNFFLCIYFFLCLPKYIYEYVFLKKHKKSFLYKLGFKYPVLDIPKDKDVVWIHAVSVGETKAMQSVVKKLKSENKYVLISNVTETGYRESLTSLGSDTVIFMPFDFPWIMKKLLRQVNPKLVIISETDLWYNFLKYAKKLHAKVVLVSAKISLRSKNRFKKVPFFTKKLFGLIDVILTQNKEYFEFFKEIVPVSKLDIGGNLKLTSPPQKPSSEKVKHYEDLFGCINKKVITIACTHETEEELLIKQLKDFIEKDNSLILLAPRHPERFEKVFNLLKTFPYKVSRLSKENEIYKNDKIILIDTMGFLGTCYSLSDIAILGGSFIASVGGHNILEPVFFEVPVLFGPNMYTQKELRSIVLENECGKEVLIKNVNKEVKNLLIDSNLNRYKSSCISLLNTRNDYLEKTYKKIRSFLS
jgi:3-deoxy-D-manno-octulosonic-acid transferase